MMDATENPRFVHFMAFADEIRAMKVRTNADTPEDAAQGAHVRRRRDRAVPHRAHVLRQGLGAAAVHPPQDDHVVHRGERRAALDELFPFVKKDIKATLAVMDGLPVTIRLLDPPLHEFVPTGADEREKLAKALGITLGQLARRADDLHESNPMMGHRGVRLGVTFRRSRRCSSGPFSSLPSN